MKQHITSDQLNELTPEQRETIARILKGYPLSIAPRLSIGQCIELLTEKDIIHLQSVFAKISHGILRPDEILDALFEAVKVVL